ncbi:MAG TPA: hypothetical protein VFU22_33740 [Roseiflexaceae bacterium]|nr:hypothetical protein [Roseiflexaceae bacterium]
MTSAHQRNLITETARAAVAELGAKELEDFDETAAEYWRNPRRVRNLYREDDEMLGFGGLELAVVAPAALYIATEVVKFLLESTKGGLSTLVSDTFKELLRRKPPAEQAAKPGHVAPFQLTAEHLAQAHAAGIKAAKELGLPEGKTELVVNAVIVHFARIAASQGQAPQA